MRELSLHILDIAENSISAQAKRITIRVTEDYPQDRLDISIEDDGKGMDAETVMMVTDPFITSRTTRKVGLGIPLLKEAAEDCNGKFSITSSPGVGTTILVYFQLGHIDRMPLGNLADTFFTLLMGHPEIHWVFEYQVVTAIHGSQQFFMDDQPIKSTLGDIPLTDPDVLKFLQDYIQSGIAQTEADKPTSYQFIKINHQQFPAKGG